MYSISKLNSISFKLILLMLFLCLFQILNKYIFLIPIRTKKDTAQTFLISSIIIKDIDEIELFSPGIKATFKKINNTWQMRSPSKILANKNFLYSMMKQLVNIKVIDVLKNDLINISNFSLDKPSYNITLIAKNKRYKFSFGLINSILNASYLRFSNQNVIYKTRSLDLFKTTITLSKCIDTNIFHFKKNKIKLVKLFYGYNNKKIALILNHKNNIWIGKKGRILDNEKVLTRLDEFFSIKVHTIFDELLPAEKEEILKKIKRYKYLFKVTTSDNKIKTYYISNILPEIKSLKIKSNQYFMIYEKDNLSYYYLIEKKHLDVFRKREAKLRAFNLKKLFY